MNIDKNTFAVFNYKTVGVLHYKNLKLTNCFFLKVF